MSCIGPIANILVQIVILIVAIGIIRIVIAAFLGLPWYPSYPGRAVPGAPAPAGRIAGAVLAILDLIFWGAIAICLIWLVVAALGCLGGFHLPRFG